MGSRWGSALALGCCLMGSSAGAEPAPRNTISASPMGVIGFMRINVASFLLNYERRIGAHHGVLVEANLVHVHGSPAHQWTYGPTVGWRFHVKEEGDSAFFGANAGYKFGHGKRLVKFQIRQPHLTAQAGYRWQWESGFTITARAGFGWGPYSYSTTQPGSIADESIPVARDILGFTPFTLDSELGFGFSF